jgi:DMSO/TMAO reductase YedYZ molybdopterin-dependent catalytic subunit
MMKIGRRACATALVVLAVAHPWSLDAQAESPLAVAGDVSKPLTLTAADLKAMPRTTVSVMDQGREVKYGGVLVAEILARAGAPLGRDMSGPAVASYVVATGKDGYAAVFSLGELDPAMTSNDIIVADTVDGQPLFDYQGPYRIVAPHDKRGARGVRMLQKLDVVRLRK